MAQTFWQWVDKTNLRGMNVEDPPVEHNCPEWSNPAPKTWPIFVNIRV